MDESIEHVIAVAILILILINTIFFISISIYNAVINLFSEPEQKKDIAYITKNEKQFLESYRKLSPVQQKSILKDIVICK